MMEKLMGAMGPVKLEHGTETKTIVGYPCTQYTITMGEGMKMIYWTTTALQPPFSPDQMYSAETGILRANPMLGRMSSVFDEMKKMKGIPLATLDDDVDGTVHVENSSEATEVRTERDPGVDLRYSCGLQEGRLADVRMMQKQ